jgi:hypothetical protein
MASHDLVEDFCADLDEESIGESAVMMVAAPGACDEPHTSEEKRWSAFPAMMERPQSADGDSDDTVSLADDLEVLELPPELGWLERATSLPGAGSPHEEVMHDSLHSGIECTVARASGAPAGSGFSRPDSRSDFGGLCSRGSTPESIVAELPELTSNPMPPSPTTAPPPERAKGKRAFMLPPRPQHGSTRPKGGAPRPQHGSTRPKGGGPISAGAGPRNDTPMPGAFSMPRPWSWRSSKS